MKKTKTIIPFSYETLQWELLKRNKEMELINQRIRKNLLANEQLEIQKIQLLKGIGIDEAKAMYDTGFRANPNGTSEPVKARGTINYKIIAAMRKLTMDTKVGDTITYSDFCKALGIPEKNGRIRYGALRHSLVWRKDGDKYKRIALSEVAKMRPKLVKQKGIVWVCANKKPGDLVVRDDLISAVGEKCEYSCRKSMLCLEGLPDGTERVIKDRV